MISAPVKSPKEQKITGQYYLRGVMETASGFKFNPDSTFNFFYSYGAIDRSGSGTYLIKNQKLILNSTSRKERDFKLISSGYHSYNGITIKIADENPLLRRYVSCSVVTSEGIMRVKTDEQGIAKFAKQQIDSIILIHLLFPDRTSIFKIANKNHNFFEFTIDPLIVNVYFNNLSLKISGGLLSGGHPLIAGNQFHYTKEY
jgi:hypothetical protein